MNLIEKRDIGFLAYWGMTTVLRRFPPKFRLQHALKMARFGAQLWLRLSPREREQSIHNLQLILGGLRPTADLSQISLTHHEALVWAFLIPDILPHLSDAQLREVSEVHGLEHLEAARAEGQGAVLLGAHCGSHGYFVVAVLIAHGCPVTAVTGESGMPDGLRRFNQKEPDRSLAYRRLIHPMRRFPRSSLPFLTRSSVPDRRMAAVLQRNEVLWILGDQHLTEEEEGENFTLPVRFLWGTAKVRSGPLRLPKIFGAPVLPTFAVREGPRLIVEIEEPLELRPSMSPDDTAADLRAYLERLEARIYASPDQWAFTRHENLQRWIRTSDSVGSKVT